jgi:hypothetical protein
MRMTSWISRLAHRWNAVRVRIHQYLLLELYGTEFTTIGGYKCHNAAAPFA